MAAGARLGPGKGRSGHKKRKKAKRGIKPPTKIEEKAYWHRLRDQFQALRYDNSGAYSSIGDSATENDRIEAFRDAGWEADLLNMGGQRISKRKSLKSAVSRGTRTRRRK